MLSIDAWGVFVPLIVAIIAWFLNEWGKRFCEQYKRKEERYQKLLKSLKGFYVTTLDMDQREAFIEQVNLCWLYSPDEVILKAYAFLDAVHTGANAREDDRALALGELIVAVRNDLLPQRLGRRTELRAQDFKLLRAT